MSDSSRPVYKRKRFWLLLLFVIPVSLAGYSWVTAGNVLNEKIALLKAEGLPTSVEELNEFYRIPDATNDSTDAWLTAMEASLAVEEPDRATIELLPYVGGAEIPKLGEEWEAVDTAREYVTARKNVLALIQSAADQGGVARFPVDFTAGIETLLPQTQNCRLLSRLLLLDSHVAFRDRDFARIHANLRAMFQLSNVLEVEPSLISQMVRCSLHGMACEAVHLFGNHIDFTPLQWEQIQADAAKADFRAALKTAVAGEAAIGHAFLGQSSMSTIFGARGRATFLQSYLDALIPPERSWNEHLSIAATADKKFKKLGQSPLTFLQARIQTLSPTATRLVEVFARQTAYQRCLVAGIAFLQKRSAGDEQVTLTDISPDDLPEGYVFGDWADPFSSDTIQVRIGESSIVVYSVGRDGVDNGGSVESIDSVAPQDWGFKFPAVLKVRPASANSD